MTLWYKLENKQNGQFPRKTTLKLRQEEFKNMNKSTTNK